MCICLSLLTVKKTAIVADDPDGICYFNTVRQGDRVPTSPSVTSLVDMRADADPLDLTPYMDQVSKQMK